MHTNITNCIIHTMFAIVFIRVCSVGVLCYSESIANWSVLNLLESDPHQSVLD